MQGLSQGVFHELDVLHFLLLICQSTSAEVKSSYDDKEHLRQPAVYVRYNTSVFQHESSHSCYRIALLAAGFMLSVASILGPDCAVL